MTPGFVATLVRVVRRALKRLAIFRCLSIAGGRHKRCVHAVGLSPGRRWIVDHLTMNTNPNSAPPDDVHLIVAKDEEVVIEHHLEDWLAFVLFWALAIIVFLQFFTRYILNDSLAWTEEIARYGLMSLAFIGGAVVTRKKAHIAVELVSNLMGPGPLRSALLALVDLDRKSV